MARAPLCASRGLATTPVPGAHPATPAGCLRWDWRSQLLSSLPSRKAWPRGPCPPPFRAPPPPSLPTGGTELGPPLCRVFIHLGH